jgi:hypothetical protein
VTDAAKVRRVAVQTCAFALVVAPDPPLLAGREDLGAPELLDQLVAEVRQALLLDRRPR